MISDRVVRGWTADGSASWVLRLSAISFALVYVLAAPGASFGQTIWNTTTGNWNTSGNWTLGVPDAASGTTFDAQIKNNGTAQLSAAGASVRRLRVGVNAGGGHLDVNGGGLTITDNLILNFLGAGTATTTVQNGGVVTVPATVVGDSGAGQSNFLITGAGSRVNATSSFVVGLDATGILTLANGGTLAIGNGTLPLRVGTGGGDFGVVRIGDGGPAGVLQASAVDFGATSGFLQFNHTGNLTFATPITGPGSVAQEGFGTTTLSGTNSYTGVTYIEGGTLVVSADANLGEAPGAHVPNLIQFNGGTLRATESFTMAATRGIDVGIIGGTIEVDATETLTFPNNLTLWAAGTMTKTGAGGLYVEDTLSISGGGVNLSGGTLRFDGYDRGASGTFNFNSGMIQLAGNRSVGTDAAIADLFGTAPSITTGKGLTVEGTATLSQPLTIAGGAFKTNGLVVGAGGALDFDRGIFELTSGTITGLSSLVIPTNGEFRARGVQPVRITGAAGSSITATGNLTLGNAAAVNGFGTQGTLQVGANTVTLLDANDVVFDSLALVTLGNAGSPGTLTAANGLTLDFGGNFTGFGAVSTPNNVAKPLINNGHITGNSASQRITLPGYVNGVGTFNNVNFTGTFSPGLSSASLIVGNIAFSPSSTLVMELGGPAPGTGHDQLQSSGALAFDSTLLVSLINGFSPVAGQSFNLFDWISTSGAFDTLNLPTLAGLAWNTSQLYTAGVLSLVAAGLPGDYNQNGTVDAADYAVWRNNLGAGTALPNDDTPGVGPDDFTRWKANFGRIAGSGSGATANSVTNASSNVPEPASQLLLIFGCAAIGLLRQRR